jgi:hypothetical protein
MFNTLLKQNNMKTITSTVVALILSGALFLLFGCKDQPQPLKLDETLMVDFTENDFLSSPDKNLIKQSYTSDKIFWEGYSFRMRGISDVDYTPAFGAEIKPEYWYLGNTAKRKKTVQNFYSGIDSAFEKINATSKGCVRSDIFIPITQELLRLSQSTAERRVLVIYSDLMEYSFLADFYQKSTLAQLQNNPEAIQQQLEKAAPLADLKGIEVKIVSQPRSNGESKQFEIVSGFYKRILEAKGAKVSISANLI